MLDKDYDLVSARKSINLCSGSIESLQFIGNALEQSAIESHGAEDDDRLATLFRVSIVSQLKKSRLTH